MWLQPDWLDMPRLWGMSDQYRFNMPGYKSAIQQWQ